MSQPLTIETLGWEHLVMLLTISSLASYTLTQICKSVLREITPSGSRYRRPVLRVASATFGGAFGFVLGGHTGLGAIIGIGAGSLTTYVFSAVKARIKKAAAGTGDS